MQTMNSDPLSVDGLEHYLDKQSREDRFSGVVLLAHDGKPTFQKAYGFASKRFGIPNQVDTKFNVGSLNKIFTTVSILQLVEKGILSLDDPLGKFRPDFPAEIGDKVTIRHLAQQRAGWGDYWEHESYRSTWARLRSVEDYMVFIKDIPLDFEPGEDQQHCNTCFEVLGALVEAVTGRDYYDYVRANIYEPVGMPDSDSYEMDMVVENLAIGFTNLAPPGGEKSEGYQRENTFMHSVKGTPAGGGYTTAADLLKFDNALRQFRLLNPLHTAMIFNRFKEVEAPSVAAPRRFMLAGGAPGINTFYGGKATRVVIILSNYDPPVAMKLGAQIMEAADFV
ncbi:MAG: beta-lactamase family protein [Anaerolineaceae bacterium]|nr:beta-lactamase family protein [Anaerolineaceae bacterium]